MLISKVMWYLFLPKICKDFRHEKCKCMSVKGNAGRSLSGVEVVGRQILFVESKIIHSL